MAEEPTNEIVAAAADAKARHKDDDRRKRWPLKAIGLVGIGSAAVAAALLYTNRDEKK